MKSKKPTGWLKRILLGIGGVVIAALFYVAVIMGQPGEQTPARSTKPLAPSAPQSITELSELEGLVRDYPAPALLAVSGAGLTL